LDEWFEETSSTYRSLKASEDMPVCSPVSKKEILNQNFREIDIETWH